VFARRALRRTLTVVAVAAFLATSLPPGSPGAAVPARAAGPSYPTLGDAFDSVFPTGGVAGSAGVVNLVSDTNLPTPASVIGQAGPGPLQTSAILTSDLSASPLADTSLASLHLETLPIDIPLSTIPISRPTAPHSWQELLDGTSLDDVPLVAVTWKDVKAASPAGLNQVSVADVDWTNSALADLPLAALTFGGADITTVMIPLQPGEPNGHTTAAQRWCYLFNQVKAGSCASPASLAGQTLIGAAIQGAPLKNIPLKNIPLKNIDLSTSPLKNIPLKNIVLDVAPLKNIPLKNIDLQASPLKNIPLKNIDLATSPLKNIPLKNIDFGTAPLKNIPLKNIDLATSPLKNIPLKNIDYTVAPLKNIPLKNIDLSTSPLKNIPLKNIATGGAPLKNIPLKNIAWASAPLKNIPLKNIDLSAAGGVGSVPLDSLSWDLIPLGTRLASDFTTSGAPFASAPAAGATLADVAAAGGFTAGATLKSLNDAILVGSADIALGDLRLDLAQPGAPAITLEQLLASLLAAAGNPILGDLEPSTVSGDPSLGDLRLDLLADTSVTVEDLLTILASAQPDVLVGDLRIDRMTLAPSLTLADFIASLAPAIADAVRLGDLRLDLATGVDALVLDALFAFLLVPTTFDTTLLGALGTYTDATGHDITLGELGTWKLDTGAEITLGELAQYLDDSVSLADVLLGLVPASEFPFENFPLASLDLNAPNRRVFRDVAPGGDASVGLMTQVTLETNLQVLIPAEGTGAANFFVLAQPGSTITFMRGGLMTPDDAVISTDPDGRIRATIMMAAQPAGTGPGAVHLEWKAGSTLGTIAITYGVAALDGTVIEQKTATFSDILDGSEPNSTADGPFFNRRMPSLPVNPGHDPYIDTLATGYISTDKDVDWFELGDVAAGSRITADLTNLPVDADLVLYGPDDLDISPSLFPANAVGLPGALVEDPGLGVGAVVRSLAAQALADLRLDQGYLDLTNIGTDGPPLIKLTPLSISQHRGSDAESVGVIAPVTGNYVVAVSGYNGATSVNPYLLRVRATTPPPATTCAARTFPNTMPAPGSAPTIPAGTNTLILTAPTRLTATFGAAATTQITDAVASLTSYLGAHTSLGVNAALVPLDAYPAVEAAYHAWDAAPCAVTRANDVVREITQVIADIRAANPGLAYITVLGGDDIVPMGRVVDLTRISNESEYASVFGSTSNPIAAAQAGGYTLTDDALGDPAPIAIGNGSDLFVPRMAVGRLVETPAEIVGQLASFGAHNGTLDTHTGLVAGYDFLADGAHAVADRLGAPGRSVETLIDDYGTPAADTWNGADLLGAMFPAGDATPLVASINAHYDHNALQPSKEGSDIVTATELVDAGAVTGGANRLAGRVLFTMGCHAGLAVPAAYVPGSGADAADLRLDWAETLSAAGVSVYVANTGFGIGDTVSVAYSERLMGLYARLLDGSLTAGQALAYAKQAYYGSLGAVGVYDTKILQQTTFYGLPFWRVSVTSGSGRYGSAGSTSATVIPPALTVPTTVDPATNLATLDHTVASTFNRVDTGARGSYWVVNHPAPDGPEAPFAAQNRPIQPQAVLGVSSSTLVAHGVMVTSLASHDVANVNPVLTALSADQATSAPEIQADQASWPARMALVSNFASPTGLTQNLVVVPGQFLGATDGTGSQRLFDNVGVRVFYANASETDYTAPVVKRGKGTGSGSQIAFTVVVDDGPATSFEPGETKGVRVGFRDFDGSWKFKDLTYAGEVPAFSGNYTWTGTATTSTTFGATDLVPWFAQAYDQAGNVATGSGKALGFLATGPDSTAPTLSFSIDPAPDSNGIVVASSATVTWSCTDAGSGIAAGDCPEPELVTAQGTTLVYGHLVDQAGNETSAVATVILDASRPAISATVTPSGWSSGASATVTFTCKQGSAPFTAAGCPAPVTVTAEGVTQVTGTVTDTLGRTATTRGTVRLDRTLPSISAAVTPVANGDGWHRAATVTVTFTCSDPSAAGVTPSGLAGSCPAPVEISTDGHPPVTASVDDAAGNRGTVSLTIHRDRTDPDVAFVGTPVITSCATTDNLSGVKTLATLTSTTVRVNGIPTTTAVCAGAIDFAGNAAASKTKVYVAPITFGGFQSPVDGSGTVNNGNAGRTYPIKFKLTGIDGQPLTVLPAVASTTYKVGQTCAGVSDALETESSGTSQLTFDPVTNTFQYNWKTPKDKGCYVFQLGLADGTIKTATFNLK
jgi:uncharacterized protein YjbI with pentapeptide repeats